MIISNGTIEIKQKVGGGLDPNTGFPIPTASVVWSTPIECQWIINKYNRLGVSNGEHFTIASYVVYIEEQGAGFNADQVRLKDNKGKLLGEFSVISIESLEAVGQVVIML